MGLKLYAEEAVRAIAGAIRSKFGTSESYTIGEMADAIEAFPSGVKLTDLFITENGRHLPPDGYTITKAIVDVPWNRGLDLYVSQNGVYEAPEGYGYDCVEINIDTPEVKRLTVTANGTYTANDGEGFNPVVVSIPEYRMVSAVLSENGRHTIAFPSTLWNTIQTSVWTGDDEALVDRSIRQYSGSVSYIGRYAFYSCSALTSVYASQCISVSASAFQLCTSMISAAFPVCEAIGESAFYSCTKLSNLSLPMCAVIGDGAFMSCYALHDVNLPNCTEIGSSAFDFYTPSLSVMLSSLSLPKVKKIGKLAFRSCYSLSEVTLPECEIIDGGAFYFCSGIKEFYAPSCKYIGDCHCSNPNAAFPIYYGTFTSCWNMSAISFPACTYIGAYAFHMCGRVSEAVFPACTSIGTAAFSNCGVQRADFPACIEIGKRAFYSCSKLTEISFPVCEKVGYEAFEYCDGLSGTIDLPNCREIGDYAFYCHKGSEQITGLSLPVCETIGYYAFFGHPIREVYLPVVTMMTGSAFAECNELTRIEAPMLQTAGRFGGSSKKLTTVSFQNCQLVDVEAFQCLPYLHDVTIPNCTEVDRMAFRSCTALEELDISKCVSIGASAFSDCTSLRSINIEACSRIGSRAFYNCRMLSEISAPNVKSLAAQVFNGTTISVFSFPELINTGDFYAHSEADGIFAQNSYITTFYAPKLESCCIYMFDGCSNLSDVSMPVMLSLAKYAFRSCTSLSQIELSHVTAAYEGVFYNAGLQSITMRDCYYIASSAFAECQNLSTASFGENVNTFLQSGRQCWISSYAFQNCASLTEITLLGRLWTLQYPDYSSPFRGTPIGNGEGVIYVDIDYYDQFMSNSMWSWASSMIQAITV